MRAFIPYMQTNKETGEDLWYFEDENGAVVGPYESEESANGAAKEGYKAYRARRTRYDSDSSPNM